MDCCIPGIGRRRLSRDGKSLYEELQITRFAGEREINTAFRRLALQYHPDKNPGNQEALERFKEINRIHKILTDEGKKAIYDDYGSFGLFIADKYGDGEVATYAVLTSWWFQLLSVLTCCCCCCCCFCFCCDGCCGHCCKDKEDDEQPIQENMVRVEELEESLAHDGFQPPIITQPPPGRPDTLSPSDPPIFVVSDNVNR